MRPICIFKTEPKQKPNTFASQDFTDAAENGEVSESEEEEEEEPEITHVAVSRLISRFETEFPNKKKITPLSKSKSFSVKEKKKPVALKRTQDDSLYNANDVETEENKSTSFHVKDLLSKFENFKAKHFKTSVKKQEKTEEDRLNDRIAELEKSINAQLQAFRKLYNEWEKDLKKLSKVVQKNSELEEKYKNRLDEIIRNLNAELEELISEQVADKVDGEPTESESTEINVKEIKSKFERQISSPDVQPEKTNASEEIEDPQHTANIITSYFNRLNESESAKDETNTNENGEKPVKEEDTIEEYSLEANHVKQLTQAFENNNLDGSVKEEETAEESEKKNDEEVYNEETINQENDEKPEEENVKEESSYAYENGTSTTEEQVYQDDEESEDVLRDNQETSKTDRVDETESRVVESDDSRVVDEFKKEDDSANNEATFESSVEKVNEDEVDQTENVPKSVEDKEENQEKESTAAAASNEPSASSENQGDIDEDLYTENREDQSAGHPENENTNGFEESSNQEEVKIPVTDVNIKQIEEENVAVKTQEDVPEKSLNGHEEESALSENQKEIDRTASFVTLEQNCSS